LFRDDFRTECMARRQFKKPLITRIIDSVPGHKYFGLYRYFYAQDIAVLSIRIRFLLMLWKRINQYYED